MSSTERDDCVRETLIVIVHFERQAELERKCKSIKKVAVYGTRNLRK